MIDQEFLKEYVKAVSLVFSVSINEAVNIQDTNFKFLALTSKMLALLKIDSAEKIIGRCYEEITDLLPLDAKLIDEFKKQNLEVVNMKKDKVYLEVIPLNGETKIYIAYKTPIINPETGNCLGIRSQINRMYWPNVLKVLFKMHGTKGLLLSKNSSKKSPLKAYPLSEMQHMVLYLCLGNYSYSEIALFINEFGRDITPVGVNGYLEQLKLIFHVKTKGQLVEKAIGLNFHTFLPNGLFNRISSIDITDESAEIISPPVNT